MPLSPCYRPSLSHTGRNGNSLSNLLINLDNTWHRQGNRKSEWDGLVNRRSLIRLTLNHERQRHVRPNDWRTVAGPTPGEHCSAIRLISIRLVRMCCNTQNVQVAGLYQFQPGCPITLAANGYWCEPSKRRA